MNNNIIILAALIFVGALSGCSISHPVAEGYPEYLAKYGNEGSLPPADLDANYIIDGQTQNHRYEFRAATVGYAHLWIVEFGKILDETLNAPYVQSTFDRLEKGELADANKGNLIAFTLDSYEFDNYRAKVSMTIKLMEDGQEMLNKSYSAEGSSKGGQMWGAGPFAMKSATLDSTRSAIDKILTQFINELP
ncbi:hypothetical protein [Halioxenophilus sp. WMMB6]|uniref:hypothetical protein n=1 Tax=Halioxenophilus sp. WMMB6 TaxID=3073815 RepID=UPI00295EA194|nr:hypothetical protein [Halioxenophilus sp. WMMB6]